MVKEEYVLYGEEQGSIVSKSSLEEAKQEYKNIKETDKIENIEDKYYIEKQTFINGVCINKNNIVVWKEKQNGK